MARDYSRTSAWAKRVQRRTVRISDARLDSTVRELLTMYCADVTDAIDQAGEDMVKELVKITKKTAPDRTGKFRKAITYETRRRPSGNVYVWGVKAPRYRITHLLVKIHATRNGGRTRSDPFLQNALDEVLPEYEARVLEALRNVE